ncbi:hypothetical protein ANCCAN_25588 [Ancylostoma caninum]|uniref:Uncharacterized protein n=1 Tax=Ancylostoma caninum TaxID=29170 RepID=A0A368F977_ANCCA|nr:hypothetical protein ANCCAN_25588 [Ancylostoma caninum]
MHRRNVLALPLHHTQMLRKYQFRCALRLPSVCSFSRRSGGGSTVAVRPALGGIRRALPYYG